MSRHDHVRTSPPSGANSAGADPASRTDSGRTRRRARAAVVGVLALGLTTGGLPALPAQAINTNPPSGPGSIEVFPMRDMIAIDGYGEQAGKKATITADAGGQVVGRTVGTIGADGFLEVNHPGGVCWGVGSGRPAGHP